MAAHHAPLHFVFLSSLRYIFGKDLQSRQTPACPLSILVLFQKPSFHNIFVFLSALDSTSSYLEPSTHRPILQPTSFSTTIRETE